MTIIKIILQLTAKEEHSNTAPFTTNQFKNNFSWRRFRALTYKNTVLLYKDHA